MRRFRSCAAIAAVFLATISSALALQQSNVPPKFPIPWGNSAGSSYIRSIPTPSQTGIQNCAASLTDGFPPLTFVTASAGGCPPFGQDFNGIFKQITQWSRWQNAGATVAYDSAFSAAIGGYPANTILAAPTAGHFWVSSVENNTTNPNSAGAGWTDFYLLSSGSTWGGTSAGSVNSMTLSITGWTSNLAGVQIQFTPNFNNTSAASLIINGVGSPVEIRKKTPAGLVPLAGGELSTTQIATVTFDGTYFELAGVAQYHENLIAFVSSGTYTPSVGLIAADVTCIGGGGAGGGTVTTNSSQYAAGAGGGEGGIAESLLSAASIGGGGVTVTIGPGGAGAAGLIGGNGGTTSFGGITATGANGGSVGPAISLNGSTALGGGSGGTASGATFNFTGTAGSASIIIAITPEFVISGQGAPGYLGAGGGQSIVVGNTSSGFAGNAGSGYGSGGSGAGMGPSNSAKAGGNGAPGACIIKEKIFG